MAASTTVFTSPDLAIKIAGIHWWYGTYSHAAECTAGYFNTDNNNAYLDFEDDFIGYDFVFDFTCLEMTDASQAGANAYCEPQELVRQVINAVKLGGGSISGENALERYD